MTLEIVDVDPWDDAQHAAWYAVYAEADRADGGPDADTWTEAETRAELRQASGIMRRRALAGRVDGEVVVSAWIALPIRDNLHRAGIGLHVAPAARRRGLGTAMLARLEEEARCHGRSVVGAETNWPYAAGPDGHGAAGVEFGRRHGYDLALGDVRRRLNLPVDDRVLDRLAGDAAAHHEAYTLRSWVGPIPEELIGGWAVLEASLETEAPTGGLDLEPGKPDPASARETEALFERQGRTQYATVALDPAGTVVAYTQLVAARDSAKAYQWGTLVRRQDRGHRLGIALKVANLRLLQRERPELTSVMTYNAEVNGPMIGVNDVLGFAPVGRRGELQKRL